MRHAAENGTIPPTQPQARQDALLPERRSRVGQILNVAMGKSRSWPAQGGAGEIALRLRFCLACGLAGESFEQPVGLSGILRLLTLIA
jgi:hypothetical protein